MCNELNRQILTALQLNNDHFSVWGIKRINFLIYQGLRQVRGLQLQNLGLCESLVPLSDPTSFEHRDRSIQQASEIPQPGVSSNFALALTPLSCRMVLPLRRKAGE